MSEKKEMPGISIVIIGLNSEQFIGDCILHVSNVNYPKDKLEIIYVDGGSRDSSVSIAKKEELVNVVELDDPYPSPGKGRNAGFKAAKYDFVQFLDSDSYMDVDWLRNAMSFMGDEVGAVCGGLFERFPERNWFHKMANYDWGVVSGLNGWLYESGETTGFGGNVLVRKLPLENSGGYDTELIAGEEADLSYRIRALGWKILRINQAMASHDINLCSFKVYTKRAYRSGYGYGQIGTRYAKSENKTYLKRIFRILFAGCFPIGLIILGFIMKLPILFIIFALLSMLRPLYKAPVFYTKYKIGLGDAISYGFHLSYVVLPQFGGMIRFFLGKLFHNPMRNKR